MVLFNRSGVKLERVDTLVARTTAGHQFTALSVTVSSSKAHRNVVIIPFPSAAHHDPKSVRVGNLSPRYESVFDDLHGAFVRVDKPARASVGAASAARHVRVCRSLRDLKAFRQLKFRLSKSILPLLEHYYAEQYAFLLLFVDVPAAPHTHCLHVSFVVPMTPDTEDQLFVAALTRPASGGVCSYEHNVFSVNTARAAGISVDEAARRCYRRLMARDASDEAVHRALLRVSAKCRKVLWPRLQAKLRPVVELRQMRRAGERRNEDLFLELDEATQQYEQAVAAVFDGDVPATERALERCLSHNSLHVAGLTMLAQLFQQRRLLKLAEQQYRLLLRANPISADILQRFALFLETQKRDYETADVLYTRALTIEPDNERVLSNFAVFLKNVRRDYDYAEQLHKRAIRASPASANIVGNYALFLYSVRNDHLKADQLFRLALALEKENGAAKADYWKLRYESFLGALRMSGDLDALIAQQLPPLKVPKSAEKERAEQAAARRAAAAEQRRKEAELAFAKQREAVEHAARIVARCVHALICEWTAENDNDAKSVEQRALFVDARAALDESTFSSEARDTQPLPEQVKMAVRECSDLSLDADGARRCFVRAMTALRGKKTSLRADCFAALAELTRVALLAAFARQDYRQCKDLMHMSITYHLDDHDESESSLASIDSLTGSAECSGEDGAMPVKFAAATEVENDEDDDDKNNNSSNDNDKREEKNFLKVTGAIASGCTTILATIKEDTRAVWQSNDFWEAALLSELKAVYIQQSKLRSDAPSTPTQSEANESMDRQAAVVGGQLASFATNMIQVGCAYDFIASFIEKQCTVHSLEEPVMLDLQRIAATNALVNLFQNQHRLY